MEKIMLSNLDVGGKCNLFHHGIVNDFLCNKNFEFSMGKVYGIIGEFGMGGAALSCGITGNTCWYQGEVNIDGIVCDVKKLIESSWYIGNDLYSDSSSKIWRKSAKIDRNTIKEQIDYGIRKYNLELEGEEVRQLFNISSERYERNINYISGERMKASAAIAYAHDKNVYCYPWMNSSDIEHLKEQIRNTINVLKQKNALIIIPTTTEMNIKKISLDCEFIYL